VRYFLLPVVLLLVSVPPIGYINGVNPLISAGVVFPGFGWFGFILLLVLVLLADFLFDEKRLFSFGIVLVLLLLALDMPGPKLDDRFASVRSRFDYATGLDDFQSKFYRLEKFVSLANDSNRSLVVLPENALGFFSELDMMVLDGFDNNKTIFAGAYINLPHSDLYANVLMQFKNNFYDVVYWQRVPVPVSMWGNGAKAFLFENPVVDLDGIDAGVFICFEQLIALTYVQTFLNDPQVLIGVSNLWWAKSTSIESIQLETMQLWSALFGVPYVYSVNE
jgi:apolipoprotein N-acyltransferase